MASTSNTTFVEQSLEGITGLEFDIEQMSLNIETSDQTTLFQLAYAPVDNAPQLQRDGSTLRIDQNGRYKSNKPAIVTVPAGHTLAVAGNVGSGDLSISGIEGPLALNVGKGDVTVAGGRGDLALNLGKGDVTISDREGDIAIREGAGDVSLTRCHGDVTVQNGSGDATAVDCSGRFFIRISKGDVSILRPNDMSLNIRNAAGDVIVNDGSVSDLKVKVSKGDIVSRTRLLYTGNAVDVEEVEPDIDVDVDVEAGVDTSRIVDVTDQGVRFNLGGIQFHASDDGVSIMSGGQEIFRANDDGVEVRRRDGREIFTATSDGAYWDTGSSSNGQYSFETSRGDIMIDIPDNQPARVELLSGSGSVTSDIPLVEVGRPGPRGATRRYVGVSAGGDRDRILVTARTHRGDLRVRTRPQETASAPRRAASSSGKSRDERRKAVLEALSQGKLNVEEAHVLLAAIERER